MEAAYQRNCSKPSDINEHLPVLMRYAAECNTVVECGVRDIVSSYAFANALKGKEKNCHILVDPYRSHNMDGFISLCKREKVNVVYIQASDLDVPPIHTDLLFIDTWHVYGQLKREFSHWHKFVKKYIILHDTTVDAEKGETIRCKMNAEKQSKESGIPVDEINKGLWFAVEEFLASNEEWQLKERFEHQNGLTILERI